MDSNLNVLGMAGSLRRGSFNRALIRAAVELAPDGMTIETFDLNPLPLFNGDIEEQGDPLSVVEFKQAIRHADALLFATPEYNYGLPGVLMGLSTTRVTAERQADGDHGRESRAHWYSQEPASVAADLAIDAIPNDART
jgi:hypothetical protein